MADMAIRPDGFVVLKFGGTSVADPDNWPRIAAVLRDRLAEGLQPVLVHSALAGVSDRLEELAGLPGDDRRQQLTEEIRGLHRRLIADLELPAPAGLDELGDEMDRLVSGLGLTGEVSPPLQARLPPPVDGVLEPILEHSENTSKCTHRSRLAGRTASTARDQCGA